MAQTLTPIILVLAFIAVVLAVQGIAALVYSSRDQRGRTNRRLTMLASGMSNAEVYAKLVRKPISETGSNFALVNYYNNFAIYCQQSGLTMPPLQLISWFGLASVGLWLLSFMFVGSGHFMVLLANGILGLPASALICGLAFWIWVRGRRAARIRLFEQQMPLALDVINRGLRAGHPVVSAVRLAADEMDDPIGSEFGLIIDETTYGYEFRDALANFARRSGLPDAQFFAVSVGIQAETGGNLAEILEGLATVIRSRATLAKRVKALSSEGRTSGALLSILPVGLAAMMLLINPTYYSSKFSDPVFWQISGFIFASYLFGVYIMHRIVNFKY